MTGEATAIEKLPFEKYVEMPELHATALRDLLVSPLLYKTRRAKPREDTDTLRQGRAVHTAVLEPLRFLPEYAYWRETDGRRYGKAWDAFCDANANKTILTEKQYTLALTMAEAVAEHPVASRIMREFGKSELTIKFSYRGLNCKARIDRLCSAVIDLKSTRNPGHREFGADSARYAYPAQLAFYRLAVKSLTGENRPAKIIAAQSTEPHDVVVYDLGEDVLHAGMKQIDEAIDLLLRCTETDTWPGIQHESEAPLILPAWANLSAGDEIDFGTEIIK